MTPTTAPSTRTVTSGRWSSLRHPAMVAGGGLVAAAVLHARDPNVAGTWGPAGIGLCPWQALTGLWCPGCGGLRAVHELTALDVGAALSANLLVVGLVVVLASAWVRWVRARWRGEPAERMLVLSPVASTCVLVTMVLFTVLRNLPAGAALAP